jgi:sulfite exporter TauE/SafE/copper chaperone CopZ
MTCESCSLLLERELLGIPGVLSADVKFRTGIARITANASKLPTEATLAAVIEKAGYVLVTGDAPRTPSFGRWAEIGASLLVVFALYLLLKTFDLVAFAPSTSGALTLWGIVVIGLVAGTSSCLAVTGGLLLAMAAKYNETHQGGSAAHRWKPLLAFNVGRLVSYVLLGGLVGVLGQSITLGPVWTGYLNIIIAIAMLYLALTILRIIPKGSVRILPKSLSRRITALSGSEHPAAPALLGALTFFLPCGFTQSLQLTALASGSFASGALIMGAFALGTLPSLLGISALSSSMRGAASRFFLRLSGAAVLVLGLFNLISGLTLAGIPVPISIAAMFRPAYEASLPLVVAGVQQLAMTVHPGFYEPAELKIRSGMPVRWIVEGTQATGCTSVLVVPSLNISKPLVAGQNVIDLPALQPGQLAFSCSMGMVRGSITVL